MDSWGKRAPELAYLLNPPFCALIIYNTIFVYQKEMQSGLTFPLAYLILPIILPKSTREKINSRTNMVSWLQKNPDVLVNFSNRARSLINFTNEGLEFLLLQRICSINNGKISIEKIISKSKTKEYTNYDEEISDCLKKAVYIGRWFSKMRSPENIFAAWGVKP